jgi:hypothetical protein
MLTASLLLKYLPFDSGRLVMFVHFLIHNMDLEDGLSSTYDHRVWRTGLPVRSAVLKPIIVRGQFSMCPGF